jgi:ribosomal protein S18 acetylase RimI-like enzyme
MERYTRAMTDAALRPTPFRGDPDVEALHAFFQPEHQFAGDPRWSFGTSLKSAYVNCFEFLNQAPIVQLWRDGQPPAGNAAPTGQIGAVSRITLGSGEWFYQAAPAFRTPDVTAEIIKQTDATLNLLSDRPQFRTVAYESDLHGIELLETHGYVAADCEDVYMTRTIDADPGRSLLPHGSSMSASALENCELSLVDLADAAQIFERGDAQTDAFADGQPHEEVSAWMSRTMRHQMSFGRPRPHPSVVAVEPSGRMLAFADPFFDHTNKIGEFEPVGTRKGMHRRGLGKAVLLRGLELMRDAGMKQAIVRTGAANTAAIAAYASVGFSITDRVMNYRKPRVV